MVTQDWTVDDAAVTRLMAGTERQTVESIQRARQNVGDVLGGKRPWPGAPISRGTLEEVGRQLEQALYAALAPAAPLPSLEGRTVSDALGARLEGRE